jgi:hypothetical protein
MLTYWYHEVRSTQALFDTKMNNPEETPKKMGRPPLPKEKSRYGQVAMRTNQDEADEMGRLSSASGMSQGEIARQNMFPEDIWVDTPWRKDQIHGKKIRFRFVKDGAEYEGNGELICRERNDGKKSVVIIAFMVLGPEMGYSMNARLPQKAVDSITELPGEEPPLELKVRLRHAPPVQVDDGPQSL